MISPEFLEFVSSIKGRLGSYPSEESVSVQIVLPVLGHLGWDIHSPDYVCPQYPLDRLKVDYGLKISKGSGEGLRCIIEVKAEGNLDADHQLFKYAFFAGAPLAVLTDGRHWRFYLPMVPGKFEERLVRTLDFGEHSHEEIINGLVRYLSFENTRSGKAKENAERDHNQRIRSIETEKNISVAWGNLLYGSSDKLVTLLIEETSQISSGYAPARSDVKEFLKNIKNIESESGNASRKKLRKPKPEKPKKVSRKEVQYFLLNERYTETRPIRAYVRIMKILVAKDKGFIMRLAPQTAGRKKKWLSQDRKDMIKFDRAEEILPGWWLCTNVANRDKLKRLRIACEVAGIPFGKPGGLKITF
ncbi:MAG: hypothetical protein OXH82_02975 [Candidatus Dadabacteria bacterium]|nr:hypothetical protein [Candidatus Dadabacteria bacterium]